MNEPHDHDEVHDHDLGLAHDLGTMVSRRRLLAFLGGAGALSVLAACGSKASSSTAAADATTATTAAAATTTGATATTAATDTTAASTGDLVAVPEETGGPYPGDGSNGVNVLTESGIVRSDITSSFGDYSGTAAGAPMTLKMTILDADTGAPLAGAAVYVWHADQDGHYSLYTAADQNYLRGVQEVASDGTVTFRSIYPGCYDGRWPHIHYEVYPSLAEATKAGSKLRTSQIALPEDMCSTVYSSTSGYESSVTNLKKVSLATDNVFRDGWDQELATATGDPTSGVTVALQAAI